MSNKREREGEIAGKEMVPRREICLAKWLHANEAEPVRWKRRSMRWLSVPEASGAVADSQRRASLSPPDPNLSLYLPLSDPTLCRNTHLQTDSCCGHKHYPPPPPP